MPKVSREHKEQRRRQILDAAFACFAHKGYDQTSMQDVCSAASLSAGALYGYFEGKEAIIRTLASESRERYRSLLGAVDLEQDVREQLLHLVRTYLDLLAADEALQSIRLEASIWTTALNSDAVMSVMRASVEYVVDGLATVIHAGQDQRIFASDLDPQASARAILSLLHGFQLQRIARSDVDGNAYARAALRFVERGLAAEE